MKNLYTARIYDIANNTEYSLLSLHPVDAEGHQRAVAWQGVGHGARNYGDGPWVALTVDREARQFFLDGEPVAVGRSCCTDRAWDDFWGQAA